jgi:DNA polymerase-1
VSTLGHNGCKLVKLTKLLYDKYKPVMDSDYPIFYNLYQPLLKAIFTMQNNGIAIDTFYMDGIYWEIKDSVEDLESQLIEEIKKHTSEEVNVRSSKQIRELLFDTIGLKPIKTSKKTKMASTNAKTLEILSRKGSNLSSLLLRHRDKAKLLSTYVKPIVEKLEDGRLHTTYNPFGTVTGRFSSKEPNLQNIPVKDKGLIRSAFIASPGHNLIIADYSQIELRLLAHFSKDERLIYAYNNNLDVHTKTAASIFGKPYNEVTKEDRYVAKAINFGLMYGMSKYRLSEEAHISIWVAQNYINKYFQIYKGVDTWREEVIKQCVKDKFVQTLFGRYRRLPDITSNQKAERQAINSIIQGSAGDVINRAVVELSTKLCGTDLKMLMQIHDELVFESPIEKAEEYSKEIKNIMESTTKLNVPLKVNLVIATNWSEK